MLQSGQTRLPEINLDSVEGLLYSRSTLPTLIHCLPEDDLDLYKREMSLNKLDWRNPVGVHTFVFLRKCVKPKGTFWTCVFFPLGSTYVSPRFCIFSARFHISSTRILIFFSACFLIFSLTNASSLLPVNTLFSQNSHFLVRFHIFWTVSTFFFLVCKIIIHIRDKKKLFNTLGMHMIV